MSINIREKKWLNSRRMEEYILTKIGVFLKVSVTFYIHTA